MGRLALATTAFAWALFLAAVAPAGSMECDANACTTGDQCSAGACVSGPPVDCNFGPCESGACVAGTCLSFPKCPPVAHPCRTTQTCNPANGECEFEPANIGAACDITPNDCMAGTCDGSGECVELPLNGTPCDDHMECTASSMCFSGTCVGEPASMDGQPCTTGLLGLCAPASCQNGSCVSGMQDVICPPSMNLCEGLSFCNPGTGQCASLPSVCISPDPCSTATCDPQVGCVVTPLADGAACNDLNECTVGDSCSAGACTGTGISDPQMAPASSNTGLLALVMFLGILPALRLARPRQR